MKRILAVAGLVCGLGFLSGRMVAANLIAYAGGAYIEGCICWCDHCWQDVGLNCYECCLQSCAEAQPGQPVGEKGRGCLDACDRELDPDPCPCEET